MFHRNGQTLCRVVVDVNKRDRIVESLHADPIGCGHYGQTATIRKVTDRFWWCSVSTDTREYVRGCAVCQKANRLNRPPPASLHLVAVGGLFRRWGIYLVGPLKKTVNGNKYIVVATEYLSKCPEVTIVLLILTVTRSSANAKKTARPLQ